MFLYPGIQAQQVSPAQQVRELIANYNYKEAITLSEKFLAAEPGLGEVMLLEGQALEELFRFREAETLFLRAWRADSSNFRIMNELAGLYRLTGENDQTIRWYKKILVLYPQNDFIILKLATIYSQTEDYRTALSLLLPLYSRDTSSFYVVKQIAGAYQELKKTDSSLLFYYKARLLNPNDQGVMVKVTNLLVRKKAYDTALAMTEEFMKSNPTVYNVLRLNAYAAYLLKDYPGSASRFRQSLRLGDHSKFTHKYLCLCRYKLEMYDSACPSFRKAWWMDTTDMELAFCYGVAATRALYIDTGLFYLNKTVDMAVPESQFLKSLYAELAGAYNQNLRPDTALDILLKAQFTDPEDPVIMFKIAYQYDYYLRKPMTALPYYKKFMKMKGTDAESAGSNPQVMTYRQYAINRIKELDAYKSSGKSK